MALTLGERTGHAAIECLGRRVEDGASGVKMVRAKGIGVARQAGARKPEADERHRCSKAVGYLVSLHRLIIAVATR